MFAENVLEFNDCLSEKGKSNPVYSERIDQADFVCQLHVYKTQNPNPKSLKEVRTIFPNIPDIKTVNLGIVLLYAIKIENKVRLFAATFGFGHSYLDDKKLVQNFGLMVALNRLDPEEIKNIYKSTLTDSSRSAKEASASGNISGFSIVVGEDLLTRIQGRYKISEIKGEDIKATVNGATSIKTAKEQEITDIPNELVQCFQDYHSKKYQETSFKFIDIYSRVFDQAVVEALNERAIQSIVKLTNEIEIIHPFELAPDLTCEYYFVFDGKASAHLREISAKDLNDFLQGSKIKLDANNINKLSLKIRDSSQGSARSVDIEKCFVGTIELKDDAIYAIENRSWYKVEKAFKMGVDEGFKSCVELFDDIFPLQEKKPNKDGKIVYPSEYEVNDILAEKNWFILSDRVNLTPVTNQQFQKFEIADLIDVSNKRFIHVKKGRNSSKEISYLFDQGKTSIDQLSAGKSDPISQLIKHLEEKNYDPIKIEKLKNVSANFNLKDWRVEFWILDKKNSEGKHNIPFPARSHAKFVCEQIGSKVGGTVIRFIDMEKNYDPELDAQAIATLEGKQGADASH